MVKNQGPNMGFKITTDLRRGVSPALDVDEVLDRFGKFADDKRVDGPFVLVKQDGTRTKPMTSGETRARMGQTLPRAHVGDRAHIKDTAGLAFRVHTIETTPPFVPGIRGCPNVKAFAAQVEVRWPSARFAGSCVCKPDSGSHCNGHNDCAAIDYFASYPIMDAMQAFLWEYKATNGVSYTILRQTIHTYGPPRTDSSGIFPYSGDYHAHLHASFTGGICGVACRGGMG